MVSLVWSFKAVQPSNHFLIDRIWLSFANPWVWNSLIDSSTQSSQKTISSFLLVTLSICSFTAINSYTSFLMSLSLRLIPFIVWETKSVICSKLWVIYFCMKEGVNSLLLPRTYLRCFLNREILLLALFSIYHSQFEYQFWHLMIKSIW